MVQALYYFMNGTTVNQDGEMFYLMQDILKLVFSTDYSLYIVATCQVTFVHKPVHYSSATLAVIVCTLIISSM